MKATFLFLISMSFYSCFAQYDKRMQIRDCIDKGMLSESIFPDTLKVGLQLSNELKVDSILVEINLISNLWMTICEEYFGRDYTVHKNEKCEDELFCYELDNRLKVYILRINQNGRLVYVDRKALKSYDFNLHD